jgi:hypothetical protein
MTPKPVVYILEVFNRKALDRPVYTVSARSPVEVDPIYYMQSQTFALEFVGADGQGFALKKVDGTRTVIDEPDRVVVRLELRGSIKPLSPERLAQLRGPASEGGPPYRSG